MKEPYTEGGSDFTVTPSDGLAVRKDLCRNPCGVNSIGAPRRWPGVTLLG